MFKATPNPPGIDPTPHDPALESQKTKEATDRALDYYLRPEALGAPASSPKFLPVYLVDPTLDDETLLVEASESLSYAHAMAGNIANWRPGAQTAAGAAIGDHAQRAVAQSTTG